MSIFFDKQEEEITIGDLYEKLFELEQAEQYEQCIEIKKLIDDYWENWLPG